VTLGFVMFGVALIWYRHGPGRPAHIEDEGRAIAKTAFTDEDFESFDYDADPVDDPLADPTRPDVPPATPPA
jgi:hypothetical protein